jgi:hypothetical protein
VFYRDAVEDIAAFLAGKPIRVIDEETLARLSSRQPEAAVAP